jgi:hypothetical protein
VIETAPPTRDQVLQQLLQWLPGLYRARDLQQGGVLQSFLSLFADELWRLRGTIEQSYRDHFIDSAQDWVIPYIADLVGTDVLFTGEAAQRLELARLNRSDVKSTLHWRRQKGTLAALQGVAHAVGGWGVHAEEMFERVVWMENLTHIRKAATLAVDLRDGEAVAQLHTPFSPFRAIVDQRTSDQRAGWYQTRNVCVFEWPIASHPVESVIPRDLGGGRFTFDPLGADTPLIAACDSEPQRAEVMRIAGAAGADIAHADATDVPIRTRDLRAHPAAYVSSGLGFALREDGVPLLSDRLPASPSEQPAVDHAELAATNGLLLADRTVLPAATRIEIDAVRLGAVFTLAGGVMTPVTYSPGVTFDEQLQLRNPDGRLTVDTVTPDVHYTAGVMPYEPQSGEYHHPVLLLRVTNDAAGAVVLPANEVIARSAAGVALQAALPSLTLAAGDSLFLYVADDGSTYYARADHQPGPPDRNPDSAMWGAYSAVHLARASEGQRRIRAGHPSGAARFRRLVSRDLCCWDRPLAPALAAGEIAIDPERGRIAVPAGDMPSGVLTVDYRFGRTAAIGAGPFVRDRLAKSTITVARTRSADFDTLQAAIDAAPDGGALPVVITILDSATYQEALTVTGRSFPGGLVIQAAALQMPLVLCPPAATRVLDVTTSTMPSLVIDGLWFAGGPLRIGAGVGSLRLRTCTLEPSTAALTIETPAPFDGLVQQSITGAMSVSAPGGRLQIADSIVQHAAATVENPSAGAALSAPAGTLSVATTTVVGSIAAVRADLSNALCYGDVTLGDAQASCVRFSRVPSSLAVRGFRCTTATPIFLSLRRADAGYMHLHPNTSPALTRGGEEGGEIGAFASAGLPWRTQNVGRRLTEYIPAGLTPVQVRILPRRRFRGVPRL